MVPRLRLWQCMGLLAAITLATGWVAHQANIQRVARAGIARAGGRTLLSAQCLVGEVARSSPKPGWRGWLESSLGPDYFDHVVYVEGFEPPERLLVRSPSSLLRSLTQVETLNLFGGCITDQTLSELGRLDGLRQLLLQHTAVTNEGLSAIRGFTGLESLYLKGATINATGLGHLRGLTSLPRTVGLQG